MTKFVSLRAKSYSYLMDDGSKDKKAKGTNMGVIKKTWIWKLSKVFRSNSTWE